MAQPVSQQQSDHALLHTLAAYQLPCALELFALDGSGTNNQVLGLRCGAGEFVVKRYRALHGRAALLYEHAVLTYLERAGLSFRVPAPLATPAGETLLADGPGLLALFPLLPGRQERPAPDLAVQAGAALGEIHVALARFTAPMAAPCYADDTVDSLTPANDPAALPISRQLAEWWLAELVEVRQFAAGTYRSLPRQVIHGDFLHANVLFLDGRLAAVLDFEAVGVDARALDMASVLYFTMRAWEAEPNWESAVALCRGYARYVTLTDEEIQALPELIRLRNGRSLVWRFRHQPEQAVWRLERTQLATEWLRANQARLIDTVVSS